jgi:DNA mismatch repair protein MutH
VAELAARASRAVPIELRHGKGFVGGLAEHWLGATAGSRDEPDFRELGVELKTIPIDRRGRPRESTFVCSVPLPEIADVQWECSRVRRKLRRVLWLPIEADGALGERRFGAAVLWELRGADEQVLHDDWIELAGLIGAGRIGEVTGHLGRALQVRPKAAHGRVTRPAVDGDGAPVRERPRGFYLRARFTAQIFATEGFLPPPVRG